MIIIAKCMDLVTVWNHAASLRKFNGHYVHRFVIIPGAMPIFSGSLSLGTNCELYRPPF